jgi:hypothetical protein
MGRNKIYITKQEKYEAERRWKQTWYRKNSDRIKRDRMQKYWTSKENKA